VVPFTVSPALLRRVTARTGGHQAAITDNPNSKVDDLTFFSPICTACNTSKVRCRDDPGCCGGDVRHAEEFLVARGAEAAQGTESTVLVVLSKIMMCSRSPLNPVGGCTKCLLLPLLQAGQGNSSLDHIVVVSGQQWCKGLKGLLTDVHRQKAALGGCPAAATAKLWVLFVSRAEGRTHVFVLCASGVWCGDEDVPVGARAGPPGGGSWFEKHVEDAIRRHPDFVLFQREFHIRHGGHSYYLDFVLLHEDGWWAILEADGRGHWDDFVPFPGGSSDLGATRQRDSNKVEALAALQIQGSAVEQLIRVSYRQLPHSHSQPGGYGFLDALLDQASAQLLASTLPRKGDHPCCALLPEDVEHYDTSGVPAGGDDVQAPRAAAPRAAASTVPAPRAAAPRAAASTVPAPRAAAPRAAAPRAAAHGPLAYVDHETHVRAEAVDAQARADLLTPFQRAHDERMLLVRQGNEGAWAASCAAFDNAGQAWQKACGNARAAAAAFHSGSPTSAAQAAAHQEQLHAEALRSQAEHHSAQACEARDFGQNPLAAERGCIQCGKIFKCAKYRDNHSCCGVGVGESKQGRQRGN
jgi:hypothetical protein